MSDPGIYVFKPYIWKNEYDGVSGPEPRSGHRMVCRRNRFYSIGGFNPSTTRFSNEKVYKEIWEFRPFTRTWSLLKPSGRFPEHLASHTAVASEDFMIVYGGTGENFGLTCSNELYSYSFQCNYWELLSLSDSHVLPTPMYGQGALLDSGILYIIGGTSGNEYEMDVHSFDFNSRKWTLLLKSPDSLNDFEPHPRYRHELCLHRNKLIVFGGGTPFVCHKLDSLFAFDLTKKIWEKLLTFGDHGYPSARRCHSVEKIKNDVFLYGGYDGKVIFEDVWRLNLITLEWTRLPFLMKDPLYFHASSKLGKTGKIYAFGGVTDIITMKRINTISSCWTSIPSLEDMCIEALSFYNPSMSKLPKKKLYEAGIPAPIINSIVEA